MRTGDDILNEYRKKRKETGIRLGSFHQERDVFCPYCGEEEIEYECYPDPRDEDGKEIQCQACDRHFNARAEIVFSTRILK